MGEEGRCCELGLQGSLILFKLQTVSEMALPRAPGTQDRMCLTCLRLATRWYPSSLSGDIGLADGFLGGFLIRLWALYSYHVWWETELGRIKGTQGLMWPGSCFRQASHLWPALVAHRPGEAMAAIQAGQPAWDN